MAALLRQRLLGMDGLRLVLEFVLFMGLGSISLRSLVPRLQAWLVLGARQRLGTRLGDLAHL